MTQVSWILFLKYLDDLEDIRKQEAVFTSKTYEPLFKDEFQWDNWAAPKHSDGKPDLTAQLTGDDLISFVNLKLFPYLKSLRMLLKIQNLYSIKLVRYSAKSLTRFKVVVTCAK